MTGDLELSVLQRPSGGLGYIAGFAITDQLIVAAGGTSSRHPTVVVSSNARHFEMRKTPRMLGLRDVLAVGDALWTCGEYGQLAMSRDGGVTWKVFDTGTDACLFALALVPDGAVWVVGDNGYAARVPPGPGEKLERIDFKTSTRLASVYALRDEVIVLGFDGVMYRWREGDVARIATGATKPLTALAVSKLGTWILVGDGGFVARSPDGAWWSRVKSGVEIDLEAICACPDGRLVVVGDRGLILVSADDGRQWKTVETTLLAHLWSVERFGGGVLIGGDDGLIAKLAPPGDETWSDRINVFGGVKPLDVVFAEGPDGFVVRGLVTYLDAIENARDDDEDDDDDDEDDTDSEAFSTLNEAGTAQSFEANYGVALSREAAAFVTAIDGRDKWSSFEELRLDNDLLPDVGDKNLFELLVRRDQHAYLGTGLVESFCGVFCIGSQGNGDTYHMELYEWDGPRQVLHFDHETHAFTGVFADSLDSLVYLAALKRANDARGISTEAFEIGLRKLRGKVAPTWHFAIDDDDPEFVALEPKRRDTEFFFYRSRWITALLKNDGVTDIDDIPRLFNADFNQVVPQDQLPARYEACEKFIPTALYSMWRAFLFDEPELVPYLEIGRRHKSRLVRDAATLIDELRDGRNELGTIKDVRAHLAKFRALDLDPRRADQRTAEAEARAKADATRHQDIVVELERAPRTGWSDLAWRWLDDGVAHRALLAKLDDTPELAAQIAALDELRGVPDTDREVMLPRLADDLAPELEAVLVGSLVRDDALDGVLAAPPKPDDGDGGEDGSDDDEGSPGWDAIDTALAPIYGRGEPHAHFGTVLPYMLGGNDPIHGISVYLRDEPVPHFHFVTYGFTDLFEKETDDPEVSGFGFELTVRLRRAAGETDVPMWTLNFLQNLARYVFGTGNRFGAGHKMGLNGPIALDHDTKLTAILFAEDPELEEISSTFGKAQFLQIVGITDDEYKLIQEWSTSGLVEILREQLPLLVTDLARDSVLADRQTAAKVKQRVEQEGSSEDLTFAGEMKLEVSEGRVRIEMGALYAAALPRAMRGRLRHGRGYTLRGRSNMLTLEPGETTGFVQSDGDMTLRLTPDLVIEIEARLRTTLAGRYRFEMWPALEIVVTPSVIRDQAGQAIDVRGVADPAEVKKLIDDENARLAAEVAEHRDDSDDDDADDADDDADDADDADDDADDGAAPPADRVRAALAMTERALRLAPDDDDAQFTHAMLLLDAERAGIAGSSDKLLRALPNYTISNRVNIAVRMGKAKHPRFGDAVDALLGAKLPHRILAGGGSTNVATYGDVAEELFSELGKLVLASAPDRLVRLAPMLPGRVGMLSALAWQACQADQRDGALALYEQLLLIEIPEAGDDRTNYLRAMNNACVQAHAAKAYDTAVRIADRAQAVAHENPYIYHSAACAYSAVGDYAKAFEQVKLAMKYGYDHLGKVEVDSDLGPLLEWPEFKALFRDWHDRQEGN
ncbi:MAG TPA: suppressor of fused domain protein [Kofleriaceae bacterium]|nr:suppressor of fused domain protein [Kofleriaceae bacterium]